MVVFPCIPGFLRDNPKATKEEFVNAFAAERFAVFAAARFAEAPAACCCAAAASFAAATSAARAFAARRPV